MTPSTKGLQLPPYPYERLGGARDACLERFGEVIDLSIGTPWDEPPEVALAALRQSGTERSYPPSIGTKEFRVSASGWLMRRFGVQVEEPELAACVGTKEVVAGLPGWLRLRQPDRDVVFYPAVSYPTYEMGAILGGCTPVAVSLDAEGNLDLQSLDPDLVSRGLLCWVNSPSNPSGSVQDLQGYAKWGRAHDVLIASDECYADFTWQGAPATILSEGTTGLLAVHSLSKRSNLAGIRAGFYAGDRDVVGFLAELRKHAGFMVPGPVQAAAVAAWNDEEHVERQRKIYLERLELLNETFNAAGLDSTMPQGAFYLWVGSGQIDVKDGWELAMWLAVNAGVLVSPGELYGHDGQPRVRVAAVRPIEELSRISLRL